MESLYTPSITLGYSFLNTTLSFVQIISGFLVDLVSLPKSLTDFLLLLSITGSLLLRLKLKSPIEAGLYCIQLLLGIW